MRTTALLIMAGALVLTGGCSKNEKTDTASPAAEEKAPPSEQPPAAAPTAADAKPGQAPAQYTVELDTTKGPIVIEVHRGWSPNGADRFYELVQDGFYNDVAFFRVIVRFMAQVGMSGDPAVTAKWKGKGIPDDPVTQKNTRGMVTFAKSSLPNSRTTQIFINLVDNSRLDRDGFAPFGKVKDMAAVDALYKGYGEAPSQQLIGSQGNAYLKKNFPDLDYIKSARVID